LMALHGVISVAIHSIGRLIARRTEPHIKLH